MARKISVSSRVLQDRRSAARVSTLLTCHYTYEGVRREAVLHDISLRGALLSSKFMPPIDKTISILLKPSGSTDDLRLEGKIVRGGWEISEHGNFGKFSVRFTDTPLHADAAGFAPADRAGLAG